MEFLFLALFFFLILMTVLGSILSLYKNHHKVTGSVVNYDSFMRKFVYKVYMSREEIIDTLKVKNDLDDLSCTFDFERSAVLFSEYGSSREYYFDIQECDGFSILRLDQVPLIGMQGYVPIKLNPFLVSKINAEIIPFSEYGI